jgi:sterol desaturase/sphingolipid hydroxylase (fatty acid hydroxylase superfamily)
MTPAQTMHAPARQIPFAAYKRQQAALSRGRLYPVTAFYTGYSVLMFFLAARTAHPFLAVAFYLAGVPVWTLVEYFSHRYVLHGRFKKSQKWYKKWYKDLANKYLDPLHWEHHERPFDGLHINGTLKDLLPLFAVAAPLSFLFPTYTLPMLLAGVVQSYVSEEWIHHCVHFYNFRSPYFKYMKKHHFYHHTSQGMTRGFGLTSGLWDVVFKTRFPEHVRQRMYGRKSAAAGQGAPTGAVNTHTL